LFVTERPLRHLLRAARIRAKIFAGRTDPNNTVWHEYSTNVLYVDVDTSSGNFSGCPIYITSLGGNAEHAQLVGVTNLYPPGPPPTGQEEASRYPHGPTAKGFRVYVNYYDTNRRLTADIAKSGFWHVNWIGIE
jgi:hypothetical protein